MASGCPLCGKAEEVLNHLLIHCPSIRGLWFDLISIPRLDWVCRYPTKDLLSCWNYFLISKRTKRVWRATPLNLFWQFGMRRNRIVFKDKTVKREGMNHFLFIE